jgi:hypothetical protein
MRTTTRPRRKTSSSSRTPTRSGPTPRPQLPMRSLRRPSSVRKERQITYVLTNGPEARITEETGPMIRPSVAFAAGLPELLPRPQCKPPVRAGRPQPVRRPRRQDGEGAPARPRTGARELLSLAPVPERRLRPELRRRVRRPLAGDGDRLRPSRSIGMAHAGRDAARATWLTAIGFGQEDRSSWLTPAMAAKAGSPEVVEDVLRPEAHPAVPTR